MGLAPDPAPAECSGSGWIRLQIRDVPPDIRPFSISGTQPDSKFDIRPDIRLAGYLEPDKPDILNIQFN